MHSFQSLINKLLNFWAGKNCLVHQGHDVEVGAGTFNPATFLRSLGPEPYNTVYVEPSRRPQDGRYGKNPNRLQLFHQLQVIMKPSPLDIQRLYLESLQCIGFDLTKHDVRFVHDDWESPTLGAWGMGWEVWMDGMEITQFTYFQSVANIALDPITVELAYGLERLSMLLQAKDNFFEMMWDDHHTYGEICKQNEQQWSHYNFSLANTAMWLNHFNDFEAEAKTLAQNHLSIPAYDFVLKASHAFNMLEARGVLSTSERTSYISRIRQLARDAALSYLEERKIQEFPLLKLKSAKKNPVEESPVYEDEYNPSIRESLLIEIGSEELPATFVPIGCFELEKKVRELLAENAIAFGTVKVFGTPRRLAVLINEVAQGKEETHIEKKGPPVAIAFDDKGRLTQKGTGFLRSCSVEPLHLQAIESGENSRAYIREIKGKAYLCARVSQPGIATSRILQNHLPSLIERMSFPKKMRWSDLSIEYARPLKWIVCLLGNRPVPFAVANITSGNISYGHAQKAPKSFTLKSAKEYEQQLSQHFVIACPKKREALINAQLNEIQEKTETVAVKKSKVIAEVLYLCEWPELMVGQFDQDFLQAPPEVLISEMVEHQKYFPLQKDVDLLSNQFVITADNHATEEIRRGNEKVLSARLADGVFLYQQDLNTSLETLNDNLNHVILHHDLGTVFEKKLRLQKISLALHEHLQIGEKAAIVEAARLCKADLTSNLVGEFPKLQGVAGKYYALESGKSLDIALAIEQHYKPRFEEDALPENPNGILLALADRLDNLVGYFSIALKPTSSNDPYALRRQAIGILKMIVEHQLPINFEEILPTIFRTFSSLKGQQNALKQELLEFITARFKAVLHEYYEFKKEEIAATIRKLSEKPYDQYCQLKALQQFRGTEHFAKLFEVYKRAKGQLENYPSYTLNSSALSTNEEIALHRHLEKIKQPFTEFLASNQYSMAYELLGSLKNPLADLFDHVKILADEKALRENRLALLQEVFAFFDQLLDFSQISG